VKFQAMNPSIDQDHPKFFYGPQTESPNHLIITAIFLYGPQSCWLLS